MTARLVETIRNGTDSESAIRLVSEAVRIPSINGFEGDVGRFFLTAIRERGLEAEIQPVEGDRFNAIGRLKGEQPGPTVLFQGHIDTVPGYLHPEPFSGAVREGKVWGRGTSDMKGPVATVVEAAGLVKRLGLPVSGEIIIAATVDEESQKKGISKLVKSDIRADMAISVEPTDLRLALGQRGCVSVRVTTQGRAGHGAAPWRGINAISKMARIIQAIDELPPKVMHAPGVGEVRSSFNVGVIQGGEQFFVIPDRCSIWIDRRTVPGESQDDVLEELRSLVKRLAASDPAIQAEVVAERQDWDWAPIIARGALACLIAPDEPIVGRVESAYEAMLGRKPERFIQDAWCETDFLVNDAAIPTVNIGPGKMELAHSSEEHIEVEDVLRAVQLYALIMTQG